MSGDSCATCFFYRRDPAGDLSAGACHRHAPRPTLSEDADLIVWPSVCDDDWCGEFKPAPRKPGQPHGYRAPGGLS
jgi:hypothetical protein